MSRILVADVPQMDGRYAKALPGGELAFVRTLAEARQALAGARCDLVLIGVHFDDSRMFDLVRAIREEARERLPIVCVRSQAPACTAVTSRSLEAMVKELGADEFVDLVPHASDEAGNTALRSLATSCAARTSGGRP